MCAREWELELVWVGRVVVVIWGVGCGLARHVKCPPDRVKTSLQEGHDAHPVEEMSMGSHLDGTCGRRGDWFGCARPWPGLVNGKLHA